MAAKAQTITYGPMLARGATPDTMIVRWGTQAATDPGQVSFRKKGDANYTTQTGSPAQDHEVILSGLSLGTQYEYSIQSGSAMSMVYNFQTCPAAGLPMDFIFYGDSRSGTAEHARIVAQVQQHPADMVFESGDIEPDGLYNEYVTDFFPVVKDLVASTPFLAAPGNHDDAISPSGNDFEGNYAAIFPSLRPSGQQWLPYYSFVCGNAMFISLNSNDVLNSDQQTYLSSRLDAAYADPTIQHVFVWFHHSAYSPGEHGDNGSVQANWVPLFNDPHHKVTAVFSGHDHLYARMKDASDVFYIVSGGAGADLYTDTAKSQATKVVSKSTYNFVTVHIAGAMAAGVAYDDTGTQLDSFSIVKPNIPPPPPAPDGGADGSAAPPPPSSGCSVSGSSFAGGQKGMGMGAGAFGLIGLGLALSLSRRRRPGSLA